jgi:hypothetical protein
VQLQDNRYRAIQIIHFQLISGLMFKQLHQILLHNYLHLICLPNLNFLNKRNQQFNLYRLDYIRIIQINLNLCKVKELEQ